MRLHSKFRYSLPVPPTASIRVGTSAFTAAGWEGSFYPAGMQPRDFLSFYSTKFDTVEVDSTFYRTPAVSTVKAWAQKTPANFVFALKVPQVITHEKCLADCASEFAGFLAAAEHLGDRTGRMSTPRKRPSKRMTRGGFSGRRLSGLVDGVNAAPDNHHVAVHAV